MKKLILLSIALFCLIGINAQTWNETQKIVGTNRFGGDHFSESVSISGNYAIIGVLGNGGVAYIFERDGSGNWNETQVLNGSDNSGGVLFGYKVAIDGDYAIVSSKNTDEDENGANPLLRSGSAYIFERDGSGIWNEVQKIVPSDRAQVDEFGFSVAINGNYAIVGTIKEDEDETGSNTLQNAGSAYIFERDGSGNWNEVQKIVPSDREQNDNFGYSVSIDNNYIIVGSRGEDHDVNGFSNPLASSGSAYIFERDGSNTWNQVQKIVAADRGASDQFGHSISISGEYAVVGANFEDENSMGGSSLSNAGSAYIYERDGGSGTWTQVQKITAFDRLGNDNFGQSVSISGDYVIVGVPREGEDENGLNTMNLAGSAYIFKRDNGGVWSQMQKIVTSDRTGGDLFGTSVSISNEYIISGAPFEDEDEMGNNPLSDPGSSYIFEFDSNLGVGDNNLLATNFKIYPNPTSGGFLNILSNYPETVKATVFDVLGKKIFSRTITNNKLDISSLSNGLYVLKLTQNNSSITKKLLIK
ncbi:T9SS type A sorting domain-containing protein [Seonamhaeicola maritimus]|nr:T9SS type A sorting domain-containing protein [Seonamhaeicola maritimus]